MIHGAEDEDRPCVCPTIAYHTLPGSMYLAAKNGELDEVRQYLQAGNDINAADGDGYTLLSSACVGGQLALVRYLHQQPYLHRNTRDWAGDTPLMHAAMMGHTDVVYELMTTPHPCRLNVKSVNDYNESALTLAISNEYTEVSNIIKSVQLPQMPAPEKFAEKKSLVKAKGYLDVKFECQVCLECYNNNERRPRSLSCGHTFCTKCINETLIRGSLRCPFCRSEHTPTVTVASDVPVNFIVDSIIQEQLL
ncbi:osteoclast-stimulating factor 1 isoform X3 [Cherax quadricarinatus]|uniref:osteoclast-stimulating factor 1 isoform X3 n=1 Tax=Cherax quadricarinatus TaxID=27406 RepID=UPI002378627D|nr:osteoclast-stimulating factor 1-like isoform X3 [Cherax quadricarinatus]